MNAKSLIAVMVVALISSTSAVKLSSSDYVTPGGWNRDPSIHYDNGHVVVGTDANLATYGGGSYRFN